MIPAVSTDKSRVGHRGYSDDGEDAAMNEGRTEQQPAPRGGMIARHGELLHKIRRKALIIIAVMITLLYWLFDSLVAGQMITRAIIALSICIYGALTQFLINSQRSAKQALQDAHWELEQRALQIETANKELELAYSSMRDSRDHLRQYMYEEDIGFLTDKEGKIEGVTERALNQTGKSREALMGSNIMDLLHERCREDFKRELTQAWNGITLHLNVQLMGEKDPKKIFEAKLTRMTVSGKRLLLAILR
jgi:PAS domain S-box-containing protein